MRYDWFLLVYWTLNQDFNEKKFLAKYSSFNIKNFQPNQSTTQFYDLKILKIQELTLMRHLLAFRRYNHFYFPTPLLYDKNALTLIKMLIFLIFRQKSVDLINCKLEVVNELVIQNYSSFQQWAPIMKWPVNTLNNIRF